jgi:hypothetical protein
MNIAAALMESHDKDHAVSIAHFAISSKKAFAQLMDCFFSNEYRLAQRAAWSVAWATKFQPQMVQPYLSKMVDQLSRTDVHDAVIRNSVRILENMVLPIELHGSLMNTCFQLVENPQTKPAIKAFSLTILFQLSQTHLDIQSELTCIIQSLWDHESPAFKSRGRKILKALHKNAPDY